MSETSQAITKKSASNLALAFILLPESKRVAMSVFYAFCREIDDIADEDQIPVEERRTLLHQWRNDLSIIYSGSGEPTLPVMRELQPVIEAYNLERKHFDEILDGVELDLNPMAFATYRDLEKYCYHVASAVGLISIEIFGYQDSGCQRYAMLLGQALQTTNILRDIGNDATRGRLYIPQEALDHAGVKKSDIFNRIYSPAFFKLAESIAQRAEDWFNQAREALPPVDRSSMVASELMGAVYWSLLQKLKQQRFPVLETTPLKLSKGKKLALTLKTALKVRTGIGKSCYGKS